MLANTTLSSDDSTHDSAETLCFVSGNRSAEIDLPRQAGLVKSLLSARSFLASILAPLAPLRGEGLGGQGACKLLPSKGGSQIGPRRHIRSHSNNWR